MQQLAFTIDERLQERMTRAEMTHLQVVVFSRMPGAATALHKIRSCDCDPVAPCASRSCKIQRRPQDHSKRIHIQEQKWKSQNPARWKRRLPILPEGATSRCRHEVRWMPFCRHSTMFSRHTKQKTGNGTDRSQGPIPKEWPWHISRKVSDQDWICAAWKRMKSIKDGWWRLVSSRSLMVCCEATHKSSCTMRWKAVKV